MTRLTLHLLRLALLMFAGAPQLLLADCASEEQASANTADKHFVVLASRSDVFHDTGGPGFVMLVRTSAEETDIGAFGVYADERGKPLFGAVPAREYQHFLHEPRGASHVVLRLAITPGQYERVLKVLRSWERRVQENALLYPDIHMNNILLVKQATEELNRCAATLVLYQLDWGLQDRISEDYQRRLSRIPFEYFKELKRLNAASHVPDSQMPSELLSAVDVSQKQ